MRSAVSGTSRITSATTATSSPRRDHQRTGRLQDDNALQASFKQNVERPATLCIRLLLAAFSLGNGAAIYRPDFFDVPTDFWLDTYWLLLCGTLISYASQHCSWLRKDPRSRRIANIYLAASISGIMACAVRITTAYVTPIQALEGGTLVWSFACMCGAGFALASAHSWRIKTKWFTGATR